MSSPNWQTIPSTTVITSDGKSLDNQWMEFHSSNNTELTHYFNSKGYLLPDLPESKINELDPTDNNFRIVVDNTNNVLKVILNGVVKTIQTD